MINISSYKTLNQIKTQLKDITYSLDDIYSSLYSELRKEILKQKEKTQVENEETKKMYNFLDVDLCTKIVKKELPLRVKLFNKIQCNGFGINSPGYIKIYSTINNDFPFINIYHTKLIKEILKIRGGND